MYQDQLTKVEYDKRTKDRLKSKLIELSVRERKVWHTCIKDNNILYNHGLNKI